MASREDIAWRRLRRRAAKLLSIMEQADLEELPETTADIEAAAVKVRESREKLQNAEKWVSEIATLNKALASLTPQGLADGILAGVLQQHNATGEGGEDEDEDMGSISSLIPKIATLLHWKETLQSTGGNANEALNALSTEIDQDLQKLLQTIRSADALSENSLLDIGESLEERAQEINGFIEDAVDEPFGEALDLLDSLETDSVEEAAENIGDFLEEVKEKADDIRDKGLDAMADTLSVVGSVQQAIDVVKAIP